MTQPFDGWTVSVHCLDGIDVGALPVRRIEGATLAIESHHAKPCRS